MHLYMYNFAIILNLSVLELLSKPTAAMYVYYSIILAFHFVVMIFSSL